VIYSDWRFTSAFILGCALWSCSTLTLVGPNTDAMCLLRMWSFHLLFVVALAPLFVKTWRMRKLVGSIRIRRDEIGHVTTALYALPIILIQVVLLLIFSFVDPPVQTDKTQVEGGIITQHVVCDHDTNAFTITVLIYEAGLVAVGCALAYRTRNMQKVWREHPTRICHVQCGIDWSDFLDHYCCGRCGTQWSKVAARSGGVLDFRHLLRSLCSPSIDPSPKSGWSWPR